MCACVYSYTEGICHFLWIKKLEVDKPAELVQAAQTEANTQAEPNIESNLCENLLSQSCTLAVQYNEHRALWSHKKDFSVVVLHLRGRGLSGNVT